MASCLRFPIANLATEPVKCLKNKETCKYQFVQLVKKVPFDIQLYEPRKIFKKQGDKPESLPPVQIGWATWKPPGTLKYPIVRQRFLR